MNRSSGLLVVNRFQLMRRAIEAEVLPRRSAAIPLMPEQVFQRYRGFDGEPWPDSDGVPFEIRDGLAEISDWSLVDQYLKRLDVADECDAIVLARPHVDMKPLGMGWAPIGFDVGYYDSEWSHFSIVLNEVVYGIHQELSNFATRLNECLLISTFDEAILLLETRKRLAESGKDIERAGNSEPIAVFVRLP